MVTYMLKDLYCNISDTERKIWQMKETEILEKLWERSEDVLSIIDAEYGNLLKKLVYQVVRDNQDTEECLNDTYMSVWNTIPPNRPKYLMAYICRVAKNIAINRLRHRMTMKRNSDNVQYIEELGECIANENVFDSIDESILVDCINEFLKKQSKRNRVIFIKRYWFGYSVKDIANELEMSERHTSVVLERLRKKLKEYLKEEGYDEKI